jgi:predicted nucleic acid-binding Zn ribbon protein
VSAVTVAQFTTCVGCAEPIPAGQVWCSQTCRNLDDPHDDQDDIEQEQAA